jgi:large subunit ribosomal protein L20
MLHSLRYAYIHRKDLKGDMRKLWITRINAASREYGVTYSQLMKGLKASGIEINRKMLADMAVNQPESFAKLVKLGQAS